MSNSSIQSVIIPSGGKANVYLDVSEVDRPLVLSVRTNNAGDKLGAGLITPDGVKIVEQTFVGQTLITGVKTMTGRYAVEVTNLEKHEVGVDVIFGFLTGTGDELFVKALSGTALSSVIMTLGVLLMGTGAVIAVMNHRYVQKDSYRKN